MTKHNQLHALISELKKTSIVNDAKIWKRIASDLEKPTRIRREVNLYKIDNNAKPDEIIVVPGKVLGTGEITKKVKVAAFNFSSSAYKKIKEKGDALSIEELMKSNPKGKKVRILG